ncbi:MAG: hypothetical protein K8V75_04190 [Methanobrevibacter woesei]|nr:hypothetical protein [Methanobrevibacter woesei]
MTVKKTATKKEEPVSKTKKILYEAVKDNPTRNYIIIGALSRAGLLKQYREEEAVYGIENIKPSITDDELNKIIKDYLGE